MYPLFTRAVFSRYAPYAGYMHHYVVAGLTIVGVLVGRSGPRLSWLEGCPLGGDCEPTGGWGMFPMQLATHHRGCGAATGPLVGRIRSPHGFLCSLWRLGAGVHPLEDRVILPCTVCMDWGVSGLVPAPLRVGLGHSQLSAQLPGDCGCCQPNGEQ